MDFWQQLIDDFNKETNNNLLLVRQPTYSDQRRQSLVISLESGQSDPDLFLMDVIWINQFYRSGWLESLTPYLTKNNFSDSIFFGRILNLVDKYNNTLYALPVFLDAGLLYYRKDLLKKYGFNSYPETWEELLKTAETIMDKEKNISGYIWQGAQYEGLVCTFLEFITSNGGGFFKDGRLDINNQKNLNALIFMRNLIYKYHISPPNIYTEMKEEEVRRAFQRGNAVYERNWSYAWSLHQAEDSPVKGKTGMTLLPHFEGNKSSATLGGWHIGISRFSDNKEKAWEFIKYITSFEAQKNMVFTIGWNPVRKDIYNDKELLSQLPRLKTLREAIEISVTRPDVPYYQQISEIIQRYVNDCLANKIKPEYALAEIQNEVNSITEIYEEK